MLVTPAPLSRVQPNPPQRTEQEAELLAKLKAVIHDGKWGYDYSPTDADVEGLLKVVMAEIALPVQAEREACAKQLDSLECECKCNGIAVRCDGCQRDAFKRRLAAWLRAGPNVPFRQVAEQTEVRGRG